MAQYGNNRNSVIQEHTFDKYIGMFENDARITDYDYNQGVISLLGRAYNKKESILSFLENKYGDIYCFRPDFIAGNGRIEFYRR